MGQNGGAVHLGFDLAESTVAAFALERDRTYVVITLIVITTLSYSLLGGAL